MKLRKNIATSENGFIFNPATGDSFSANPLAAEVLKILTAGRDPAAIRKEIAAHYDVDGPQLDKDLDDFMVVLRDHNLIEP
jgi:hypothetical protein